MFFKDLHFLYTSLSNQGTFENDILSHGKYIYRIMLFSGPLSERERRASPISQIPQ